MVSSRRILIPRVLEEAMDLPVAASQTTTPSPWMPPRLAVSVDFGMRLDGNRIQGFKYRHGGTWNRITFSCQNALKYYYNFEIWKEKVFLPC